MNFNLCCAVKLFFVRFQSMIGLKVTLVQTTHLSRSFQKVYGFENINLQRRNKVFCGLGGFRGPSFETNFLKMFDGNFIL